MGSMIGSSPEDFAMASKAEGKDILETDKKEAQKQKYNKEEESKYIPETEEFNHEPLSDEFLIMNPKYGFSSKYMDKKEDH